MKRLSPLKQTLKISQSLREVRAALCYCCLHLPRLMRSWAAILLMYALSLQLTYVSANISHTN